jgi:multiple sugar transport system permease protein
MMKKLRLFSGLFDGVLTALLFVLIRGLLDFFFFSDSYYVLHSYAQNKGVSILSPTILGTFDASYIALFYLSLVLSFFLALFVTYAVLPYINKGNTLGQSAFGLITRVENVTLLGYLNASLIAPYATILLTVSLLAFIPSLTVLVGYFVITLMLVYPIMWLVLLLQNKIDSIDAFRGALVEVEIELTKEQVIKALPSVLIHLFLFVVAFFVLLPFYWMFITSLKGFFQIQTEIPPTLWVAFRDYQIDNYLAALNAAPYLVYMKNTLTVAIISTIGTIITTIFAAFAFARLNFKGRDILFAFLISSMMIPGEMFVITNYITISDFGWLGAQNGVDQTYPQALAALTLPFMTSIFYIFFLRQTFKQIPDELYLASKVDGTSDFKYLFRIMVPIASPTIITIIILNAMGTWSAYIWPNLVTTKDEFRLVTNGLRNAYTDLAGMVRYNEQMAAAMIVTLPLLIVFLLLKKYIMRGVSRSGIKG